MSDFAVKGGTTARLGRVEGELTVGRNAIITAEAEGKVVVTGGAHFEGPVRIDCDFECQSMTVEGRGYGPAGDVVILGNLLVHGSADLNASVRVKGTINCEEVDVGGHLRSGTLTSKRARVGGHMTIDGRLEAQAVDVGGHMKISDSIETTDLRVGGHAEVGGGRILGEIKVRGHFTATKKLEYGQLQVFGSLKLPAGSTGGQLTALGKVRCEGDTSCRELVVNGVAVVLGDCKSESVKVLGKLEIRGSLVAKTLEDLGVAEVEGALECDSVKVNGKLEANQATVTGSAHLAGDLTTARGLKARTITIGQSSRVSGPLVAEELDIGREIELGGFWAAMSNIGQMTRVGDVYGKKVKLWRYSRAKRIFAESVELGRDCFVDKVVYTNELKLPTRYRIEEQATKATKLPDPPF